MNSQAERHRHRGYKRKKRLARSRNKSIGRVKNDVLKLIDSGLFSQAIEPGQANEVQQ